VLKKIPTKDRLHNNLGVAYQEQGRLDDAIKEYQTAINLKPDYADAHNNLGAAHKKKGRLKDSAEGRPRS
jgi:Flp pilus assembly protein TadD